jgi:uncharacterized protein YjeT (DUF2065 family)
MRSIMAWILGVALTVNGLAMLAAPAVWYAAVPGVSETGALNHHFIRDLGAVCIVAGLTMPWFALDAAARPAAQAGAAFLVMHAIVHLWDAAVGREHVHALLVEIPTVFLPAILAVWIVWPLVGNRSPRKEKVDDQVVFASTDRRLRANLEL